MAALEATPTRGILRNVAELARLPAISRLGVDFLKHAELGPNETRGRALVGGLEGFPKIAYQPPLGLDL